MSKKRYPKYQKTNYGLSHIPAQTPHSHTRELIELEKYPTTYSQENAWYPIVRRVPDHL